MTTVKQYLAEVLLQNGVGHVFGVPADFVLEFFQQQIGRVGKKPMIVNVLLPELGKTTTLEKVTSELRKGVQRRSRAGFRPGETKTLD